VTRSHLFLVAGEGILNGLSGVADSLLGGGEDALALVRSLVLVGAGGVTDLLGSRLLVVCKWLAIGMK
jgi:hypothetical protein